MGNASPAMTVAKALVEPRVRVMGERRTRSHAHPADPLQKPKRFGIVPMPTVLRFRAMRFVIYVGDHEPPHVHVKLPGGEVVVTLDPAVNAASVRKVRGDVGDHELRRIDAIVMEHFETLLAEWRRYHP